MWDLPGGKVDDGEKFDEALLREVSEETGLTISLEHVVGATEFESPTHRIAYIVLEGYLDGDDEEVRLNGEHDEYNWIEVSELLDMELCRQYRPIVRRYLVL